MREQKYYRGRIPSLSTIWVYRWAYNKSDFVGQMVKEMNSTTVDYSDIDVWEIEEVHPTHLLETNK